ncbi:MAG: c-type cytochrome [Alphaproteobacteria bacterium]|nr:c-type cytochrome [Alphaproteobacteria bacterium]
MTSRSALAAESPNPLSGNKDAIKAGQTIYRANCGLCHGMRANGRGRGLPNSADLRKYKRGYSKYVYTVKNGGKTMPPFGGMKALDDTEIDQVGAYLETLAIRGAKWADPAEGGGTEGAAADPAARDPAAEAATALPEYQAHLDHIMVSWGDTPGKVGLATILEQEAEIAGQHAGFAASDLEDMDNIILHTAHVRHAIDPTTEAAGPGKNYGVAKAAAEIVAHMDMARQTADATDSVKTHAEHVISSANNITAWSKKIVGLGDQIRGGTSPISAAFYAEEIVAYIQWILNGNDADGDGTVSWTKGEGGLAQIRAHVGYIE